MAKCVPAEDRSDETNPMLSMMLNVNSVNNPLFCKQSTSVLTIFFALYLEHEDHLT